MKKLIVMLMAFVSLFCGSSFLGNANADTLIYEQTFSSDPGWTTNNNTNFHWDAYTNTYYAKQQNINGGGYYSYYDVGHDGSSFTLEYDIILNTNQYASDLSFGIFDSAMNNVNCSYIKLQFTAIDQGRLVALDAFDTSNEHYQWSYPSQFSLGTWYHVSLAYDDVLGEIEAIIHNRETGSLSSSILLTGVGPFSDDMSRIGISNVRTGNYQCPGAWSDGYFDNVSFSVSDGGGGGGGTEPVPEPATMLLLGSGLVGLAGFRKRFRKN